LSLLTNDVALPAGRRREAAGALFLGGVLRRAASAAGRVFRNFASFGLFAFSLAADQACSETPDVVAHTDRAGKRVAFQSGAGQGRRFWHRGAANHVALPAGRGREAALALCLGGDRGRAASATGRVFRNFAAGRPGACFLAVLQACAEAFDVVAHADRASEAVALQTGAGQFLDRGTTNHVALPALRRSEAAGASSFGGIPRRAASAAGRVFRDFAASGLLAFSLAVGQACFEAFHVVAHADRAGNGVARKRCPGQFRSRFCLWHGSAANHVALPALRRREAALAL